MDSFIQSNLNSLPEYNILLLGETGAGKSTTINAFANYLKYGSFAEAKSNQFVQLISSKFTLPDPKSGEPIDIRSGSDENEKPGHGASSTQSPVEYTFQLNDRVLRLIDTPGMGDTAGVDVDKDNFDKILAHLNNYKQLHGICLLIKSNETRKTAFFRYCITELLAHLHKSACANLVFCFTFSRNSFYGPGEGFATLRSFLEQELNEVPIKLQPNVNCYFIDNEAYRFLVAQKQGYPSQQDQERSYHDSWQRSTEQSNQMWKHVQSLPAHQLESTCSLNNVRKLILELAEPMVQLQNNIKVNIEQIKHEEERVRTSTENKRQLALNLSLEIDDLEMKQLDYPRTVCTAAKCTEVVKFQGREKINYNTHCHEHCYLNGVTTNSVGHSILRSCSAMGGQLNCQHCGCAWEKHMHITVEYIKVKRIIIDSNLAREIQNNDDAILRIERALQTMRELVFDYEHEYRVIQEITSKFAYLLISNSTTPYNRFIEPYLELLMDEELKKMSAITGYQRKTYESLLKMKEAHQESVRILTEAIKNNTQESVRLEDIEKYRDQLYKLKYSGPQFQQMMRIASHTKKEEFTKMKRQHLDLTKKSKSARRSQGNRQTNPVSETDRIQQRLQQLELEKQQLQKKLNRKPASYIPCTICNESTHRSIFCNSYTPTIRAQIVSEKGLCPICLIPSHQLINCRSDFKCAKCRGKHSSAICLNSPTGNINNFRKFGSQNNLNRF